MIQVEQDQYKGLGTGGNTKQTCEGTSIASYLLTIVEKLVNARLSGKCQLKINLVEDHYRHRLFKNRSIWCWTPGVTC